MYSTFQLWSGDAFQISLQALVKIVKLTAGAEYNEPLTSHKLSICHVRSFDALSVFVQGLSIFSVVFSFFVQVTINESSHMKQLQWMQQYLLES